MSLIVLTLNKLQQCQLLWWLSAIVTAVLTLVQLEKYTESPKHPLILSLNLTLHLACSELKNPTWIFSKKKRVIHYHWSSCRYHDDSHSSELIWVKVHLCHKWINKLHWIWENINSLLKQERWRIPTNAYISALFACKKDIFCSLLLCSWCSVQPKISADPTYIPSAPSPPAQTLTLSVFWLTRMNFLLAMTPLLRKRTSIIL